MAAISTTLCGMGLLDDAIREHLDLKRRRGADPTEVERSEREALGPVRRTPERVPGDDANRDPGVGPEAVAIYDDGLVSADEPGESAFAPGEPAEIEEDEPSWSYDESAAAAEPGTEPEEAVVPPPHRADATPLDDDADHTAEYDVAAAFGSEPHPEPSLSDREAEQTHAPGEAAAPPGEDEDVLEETPEFLQDTPDHDRLWFEQRPPKDFDFNG